MIGYKGIEYKNGILRSKNRSIFELGIQTPIVEICSEYAFSECGYSFCGTIEDVIYWEQFVQTGHPAMKHIRLFEIETVGNVAGADNHFKAESIIVKREVSQIEIIEYLLSNSSALQKVIDNIGQETFDIYRNRIIKGYSRIINENEIKIIYFDSCLRKSLNDAKCIQNNYCHIDLELCEGCDEKGLPGGIKANEHDYWYLMCRAQLYKSQSLNNYVYHKNLKNSTLRKKECEMLEEIEKYIKHERDDI